MHASSFPPPDLCAIRDPDSRERWAPGMCHRREGHEAAIREILPTTIVFVAIELKWLTPDARCKVSLVRNVGVCPSLAWQASEDGFGVGERGLRRAWAGDAIPNFIVDLTLSWAGCTHRRSVAPGASTLPGWLARRAPRGATTSQEAEGAVSGVRSAQWTTGKTITRSTAPTTSSRVIGAH